MHRLHTMLLRVEQTGRQIFYLCDMTYCFSVMGSCKVGLCGPLLPSAALPASADAWLRLLHWCASQWNTACTHKLHI